MEGGLSGVWFWSVCFLHKIHQVLELVVFEIFSWHFLIRFPVWIPMGSLWFLCWFSRVRTCFFFAPSFGHTKVGLHKGIICYFFYMLLAFLLRPTVG